MSSTTTKPNFHPGGGTRDTGKLFSIYYQLLPLIERRYFAQLYIDIVSQDEIQTDSS